MSFIDLFGCPRARRTYILINDWTIKISLSLSTLGVEIVRKVCMYNNFLCMVSEFFMKSLEQNYDFPQFLMA